MQDEWNPGYGRGNDALSGGETTESTLQDLGISETRISNWKAGREVVLSFGSGPAFNAENLNEPKVSTRPGIDSLTGLPVSGYNVGSSVDDLTGTPKRTYTPPRLGM